MYEYSWTVYIMRLTNFFNQVIVNAGIDVATNFQSMMSSCIAIMMIIF